MQSLVETRVTLVTTLGAYLKSISSRAIQGLLQAYYLILVGKLNEH